MVYIDVDLTLVNIDGELLPNVREKLAQLQKRYDLVCWSAGGRDYATSILESNKIISFFVLVLDKPFIIIDDHPESITEHAQCVRILNKDSWEKLWEKIFDKEVF